MVEKSVELTVVALGVQKAVLWVDELVALMVVRLVDDLVALMVVRLVVYWAA